MSAGAPKLPLACGIALRVFGDPSLVDRALQGFPIWFLSGVDRADTVVWDLEFHLCPDLASGDEEATWTFCADEERCDTAWGSVIVKAAERVCRVEMPSHRGLGHLTHIAVGAMLRQEGFTQLHSAAVAPAGDDPRAVLIAGPSASGKTTLTLNLVERGWRYLTDDSVAIRPSGPLLTALPMRPRFMLVRTGDTFKCPMDPEERFPGRRLRRAEVGAVVFLDRTPERACSLTRLSRVESLSRLPALTHSWSVPQIARAQMGVLARIAALPAFLLHAGADVRDGGDSADRTLRACLPLALTA